MKNVLYSVAVLCCFPLLALAQNKELCLTKPDVVIAKDKPTVYIDFDRVEGAASDKQQPNQKTLVWLRLRNNTRWAISFPTERSYLGLSKAYLICLCDGRQLFGLRDGIEVDVAYQLEAEDGEEYMSKNNKQALRKITPPHLPSISRGGISATSWLPSGSSIIFRVPREHLAKYLEVYIPFHYEWETEEKSNESIELSHRVYFRANDMPNEVR